MAQNGEEKKPGSLIDNNDIGNEGKMFVGGLSKIGFEQKAFPPNFS